MSLVCLLFKRRLNSGANKNLIESIDLAKCLDSRRLLSKILLVSQENPKIQTQPQTILQQD